MSRRNVAVKRPLVPDSKYGSVVLGKFINAVMISGKKSLARDIVYSAFARVEKKYSLDPKGIFDKAVENVQPAIEVKSVRVGGANYQVPSPVSEERGRTIANRWILDAARKRSGRSMEEKLADEFFDAANGRGGAIKKKDDTRKMAESNRAFSHFAQNR